METCLFEKLLKLKPRVDVVSELVSPYGAVLFDLPNVLNPGPIV